MELLLNCGGVEKKINDKLQKLKNFALDKNRNEDIDRIAQYITMIHSYDLEQSNLPLYNSQWIINLVKKNYDHKSEIISALEMMAQMEHYNTNVEIRAKDKIFLTWDISMTNWHSEYKSGHIGSSVWDIAVIINYVNDPLFSDKFLESYIRYGGKKPKLISIYANL